MIHKRKKIKGKSHYTTLFLCIFTFSPNNFHCLLYRNIALFIMSLSGVPGGWREGWIIRCDHRGHAGSFSVSGECSVS